MLANSTKPLLDVSLQKQLPLSNQEVCGAHGVIR
jgi:hypothetical protein